MVVVVVVAEAVVPELLNTYLYFFEIHEGKKNDSELPHKRGSLLTTRKEKNTPNSNQEHAKHDTIRKRERKKIHEIKVTNQPK